MKIHQLLPFLLLIGFYSCDNQPHSKARAKFNQFAQGFHILQMGEITRLDVFNPWENARNFTYSYYLVPKSIPIPDSLSGRQIIRTPVEKVVVLSTTHIGFIEKLGFESSIVGVSGKDFVTNPIIRQGIDQGRVHDVGYDQNLNYELLLQMKPDLVMAYGIGSDVAAHLSKMKDLNIPVVINAEYLEETPLGRAEWLVFTGSFYNQTEQAQKVFQKVVMEYDSLKGLVSSTSRQPIVLTGLPYKDNWWVPGGKSYMANLIADAGGDYLWKDNTSRESFVVSLENAIVKATQADLWINTGQTNSIQEILDSDERFKIIPSLQKKLVYNDNKQMNPTGGNEVWETGSANPQYLLHDLIHIFHPEIKPDGTFHYYQKLN
ncbi:MAG TPA: ABC transporter substrate-binding protein [Prolixibacteraceae bacterium]|jgi:iron complex transport system substrate-binding protein|nr:ABC transporter substrate-binding protein [Prolixibacteraceae bacterium]